MLGLHEQLRAAKTQADRELVQRIAQAQVECADLMPSDWLPKVLNFRVDEETFMRIEREMREERKEERKLVINNL